MYNLSDFKNVYQDQRCYIVGKGPSLQYLSSSYFVSNAPIICINESIVAVQEFGLNNDLFSMQKDGYKDHMVKPNDNVVLILQNTEGYSRDWYPEHEKRLLIDPVKEFNFKYPQVVSIRIAIALCIYMGCSFITFLCCDILTNKDKVETYDPIKKEISITGASRFYRSSRIYVIRDIKKVKHEFILPN